MAPPSRCESNPSGVCLCDNTFIRTLLLIRCSNMIIVLPRGGGLPYLHDETAGVQGWRTSSNPCAAASRFEIPRPTSVAQSFTHNCAHGVLLCPSEGSADKKEVVVDAPGALQAYAQEIAGFRLNLRPRRPSNESTDLKRPMKAWVSPPQKCRRHPSLSHLSVRLRCARLKGILGGMRRAASSESTGFPPHAARTERRNRKSYTVGTRPDARCRRSRGPRTSSTVRISLSGSAPWPLRKHNNTALEGQHVLVAPCHGPCPGRARSATGRAGPDRSSTTRGGMA